MVLVFYQRKKGEIMLNRISVLFPISSDLITDQGPRGKAFKWIKEFYATMLPEVELCIGKVDETPFSRSRAINTAAAKASRDIFAIADTDVLFDPLLLEKSIEFLDTHTWVLPFEKAMDLSQQSTEQLLRTSPKWPIPTSFQANEHRQIGWGLMNIIPRKLFETVQGFDERFLG